MKQLARYPKFIYLFILLNSKQRDKTLKIIEDFQKTNEKNFSNLTSQKCSFDSRNITQVINAKTAYIQNQKNIEGMSRLSKESSVSKVVTANTVFCRERIPNQEKLPENQSLNEENITKKRDNSKRRRSESADSKCSNHFIAADLFQTQTNSAQLFKEGQSINLLNSKTEVKRGKQLKNELKIKNNTKYSYHTEKDALKEFDDMRQQVLITMNNFKLSQQQQQQQEANNQNLSSQNRIITQNIKSKYLRSSLEDKKQQQIASRLVKQNILSAKQNENDQSLKIQNSGYVD